MAGPYRYGKRSIISLVILLQLAGVRAAVNYCSSSNTGSTSEFQNFYQSNGWCSDECRSAYSWAIVSGYSCWCSNSAPPSANDMSECNEPCPGRAIEERCGNSKTGMYGYIYLGSGQPPVVQQARPSSSTSLQTAVQSQTSSSISDGGAKPGGPSSAQTTTEETTSSSLDAHTTSATTSSSPPTRANTENTSSSVTGEQPTTVTTTTSTEKGSSLSTSVSSQLRTPTITAEVSTPSPATPSHTSSNTSPTTIPNLIIISTVTVTPTALPNTASTSSSSIPLPAVTQYNLVTSVLVSMHTVTVLSTPENGSIEVVSSISTMTTTAVYNASVATLTTTAVYNASVATLTTTAVYNASITTSSEPPSPLSTIATDSSKHRHRSRFWDSPGKVAATFVPTGLLLITLIMLFIWVCLRRRWPYNYQDADLLRFHSDVSSSGTIMQNHQESAFVYADEKGIHTSPGPRSNRNARNSSALLSTSTVAANSSSGTDSLPVSRDSKTEALLFDQRLDPSHVMSQWGESGSRVSLADDVDYSRKVLRVINE